MSTPATAPSDLLLLHTWTVTVEKDTPETTTETRDGQSVTVTKTVKRPVVTRFALKQPTRRELRAAEKFYGREYSRLITDGHITRQAMETKHLNLTGDVLSEKERARMVDLRRQIIETENDLARGHNAPADEKAKLQDKLAAARTEFTNLQALHESIFAQTAEVKAQNQLSTWFSLFLVLVERGGRWVPFFEGEKFEDREECLFKMDEARDPLYLAATDKISVYVYWFNRGVDTPEAFKAMDEEMEKQLAAGRAKAEADAATKAAAEKAVAAVTEPTTPLFVAAEVPSAPPGTALAA